MATVGKVVAVLTAQTAPFTQGVKTATSSPRSSRRS